MEKRAGFSVRLPRQISAAMLFSIILVFTVSGCVDAIRRGQSPDNRLLRLADGESETEFVGDVTAIRGVRPLQIEGIGLVVGLDGTGSDPRPGGQKDALKNELRRSRAVGKVSTALASPNTAMVLIRGFIPPVARKGDLIDLEVVTLPKTKTTSLRHGELVKTDLRPLAALGRGVKRGQVAGEAAGKLLLDSALTNIDNRKSNLKARILGGGVIKDDRDLFLVINAEETSVKLTRSISHSINERYSSYAADVRENTATPLTDRNIRLIVPEEYKHNLGRFIQALQAMAYNEPSSKKVARVRDLESRLLDPATARRAAIELEAIGEPVVSILKRGLDNTDFEVRFYAAESLAYLQNATGVELLKSAAQKEPAFRWHALTALATIGDASAKQALRELLHVESDEARYGAFRALAAIDADDSKLSGRLLGDEFYFHDIESDGSPLIHFAQNKRPEIVVFGDQKVSPDFLFVQAGLTARAIDANRVRIVKYDAIEGEVRLTCSSDTSELIKTLTRFGVDYGTLLAMFREADSNETLNARLVIDAAPRIGSRSLEDSVSQDRETSEKYISTGVPELFGGVPEVENIEESD